MSISFRWLLAALLALAALPCLAQAAVVPEAPPVLVFGGVGMVAARPMAEITGATIAAQGKAITLTHDTHRFTFTVGSTAATQDGKKLTLPLAPFQYLGVTYVPVNAFIAFLGGTATESYTDIPGDNMLQVTVPGRDSFTLATQQQYCSPEELQQQTLNIFLANCDGGRVQQLTYDVVNEDALGLPDRDARFTPDGKAIIYTQNNTVVQRRFDIPAVTKFAAATAGKMINTMPVPCPDGSLLLVQVDMTAMQAQLCRISADSTECKALATGGIWPVVSADGKTIAYTDITDQNNPVIHIMNADGANNRALFPGMPRTLNPDGTILYAFQMDAEDQGMTTTLREVTVSDGTVRFTDDQLPSALGPLMSSCAFSLDGKRVVYQNGEDGIWVMNVDHTDKRKLTDGKDSAPLFSPDGTHIAFLRDQELYVMQDDGTQGKALTTGMMVMTFAFSPDGKQLLFSGVPKEALTPKKPAEATPTATGKYQPPTEAEVAAAQRAGTRTALIKTAKGNITVELYGKDAPLTVANFVKLAQAKFYNGLTFHRVVEDFVIQGGDPNGDGTGGPGYTINLEIAPGLKHVDGALAMARSQDPDSAGSQFYITIGEQSFLDGQYAVFGKVIKGLDVVRKISKGDKIISVTVK